MWISNRNCDAIALSTMSCYLWNPGYVLPIYTFDDKSILVQVMAWRSRVTSHYRIQFWASSTTPYGVTRPLSVIDCWRKFCFTHLDRWRAQVDHKKIVGGCLECTQLWCFAICVSTRIWHRGCYSVHKCIVISSSTMLLLGTYMDLC